MPLPKEMLSIPLGLIILSSSNCNCKSHPVIWAWWLIPISPVLGKLQVEGCKFKITLSYIASSRLSWTT